VLLLIAALFFAAYRFVMRGIHEIKMDPMDSTRKSLQEDLTWARQLLTRDGK
jgi:hypothetical protein